MRGRSKGVPGHARLLASLAAVLLGLGVASGALRAQTSAPLPIVPPAGNSAAQLYNSANAYARAGQTAQAVLQYERARVFAPTDADLLSNLHRVRESAGVPDEAANWLEEYGRFADPNVLYWVGVAGLLLAGGCVLALQVRGRFRAPLLAGAVVGFAALGAGIFNAAGTAGVLFKSVALKETPASVSPVAGADALFQVPAASMVHVVDRHGGFELIRDSKGREGWVAAADVAAVVPRN
jgi:hypothetical protein